MTTPILITVDPGETVGYALIDVSRAAPIQPREGQPRQLEWSFFLIALDRYLEAQPPGSCFVVVEQFTITTQTAKNSPQPRALKVIGVVEWLTAKHGHELGPFQQPSSAMNMATNKVLRGLGWYRRGEDHANDALRHAVLWLVTNGHLSAGQVLAAAGGGQS